MRLERCLSPGLSGRHGIETATARVRWPSIGGVRGGISGRREWAMLMVLVLGLGVFAIGFGSCMYAMALYG